MKFSVLIPVYNAERYIERCVEGVLRQQAKEIEIVLVDDGSTDESGAICDRLAGTYPQTVRVIHQNNQGQLAARWNGIRAASGEYCLFLDADDALSDGCFAEMREMLDWHGEPDLLLYSYVYAYPDGSIRYADKIADGERVFTDKTSLYRMFFEGFLLNPVWTKLVRRDVLLRQTIDIDQYTVLRCAEDRLFSMEIISQAETVVYCDRCWYRYQITPNSVTRQFSPQSIGRFNETILYDITLQYMRRWGLDTAEWIERYEAQMVGSTVHTFNRFYEGVTRSERRDVVDYDWLQMLPASVAERVADNSYISEAMKRYWMWIVRKKRLPIAVSSWKKWVRKKYKTRLIR